MAGTRSQSGKIIEEVYVSGVIQFFNKERGFGFINRIGDDGRRDYFFHFSEIEGGTEFLMRAIKLSLLVIFDIGVTPTGKREAINIKIFDTRLQLANLGTCSMDCPCRNRVSNGSSEHEHTHKSKTDRKMVC